MLHRIKGLNGGSGHFSGSPNRELAKDTRRNSLNATENKNRVMIRLEEK